jgi:hypothetical protein
MPGTTGTMALTSDIPTVSNGTLTMAVSGTGLSGSASFTANQSGSSSFTVTSNATNANTASTIVARDASGNFTAGTITAALSGNASTVTNGVYTTGAQSIAGVKTFSDTPIFSGGTIQVGSSAGTYRQFRYDGTISSDGTNFYTLLNSNNYTSYSPSLTGSGASGTWGINVTGSSASCTGNAATATTATYLSSTAQTSLIVGKTGTTADINSANDTGSFSARGDSTYPASMSFHRVGAYAINCGLSTSNNFVIGGWSASSNAFSMTGAGALTMLNNITAYSDERVKTNWRDLRPDFIERLAEVKHGIYDRTDIEETQVGVSAQSLQKILEHAVMESEEGALSVAYGNAALVAAVKLAERVVALEARLAALEAKG